MNELEKAQISSVLLSLAYHSTNQLADLCHSGMIDKGESRRHYLLPTSTSKNDPTIKQAGCSTKFLTISENVLSFKYHHCN